MSIKKHVLLGALALALALSGCKSVSLDDAKVEDRASNSSETAPPASTPGSTNPIGGLGGSRSAVAPTTTTPQTEAKALEGNIANVSRLVYFDYDSNVIKPEFQALIEAHARYIRADRNRKVVIEGHTDERGGREYNLALGQRRAEAVRRALTLLGVADDQLEAISFGKEKPAVQGSNEEAWAKNRRAEIRYR